MENIRNEQHHASWWHRKLKIGLVEDDNIYGPLLASLIEKMGHFKVSRYHSGEHILTSNWAEYDIIILDYFLNDMSGLDVLKEIKQEAPKQHVIVLSGYNDPPTIKSLRNAGADTFILKSEYSFATLERCLKKEELNFLNNHNLRDSAFKKRAVYGGTVAALICFSMLFIV